MGAFMGFYRLQRLFAGISINGWTINSITRGEDDIVAFMLFLFAVKAHTKTRNDKIAEG